MIDPVKSPLRYPGGKSKAVNFLSKFVPNFKEFREPMCGGASMTLYFAQIKPDANYIMGDINYDLYCFWKTLKEMPEKLIKEIRLIKSSFLDGRRLFEELMGRRERLNSCFERAVDFYVLNRITFSGTVDCGGYSESAFRKRFTESSIERLFEVSRVLKKVEVVWSDYEELLTAKGEDVFVFLDPPYFSAQSSKLYGKRGILHVSFNHERLAELVKECEHKVMITYDNSPYIRRLYANFYLLEWRLKYGMTNYGKDYLREGDELLITNYPLEEFFKNLKTQHHISQKVAKYYA